MCVAKHQNDNNSLCVLVEMQYVFSGIHSLSMINGH